MLTVKTRKFDYLINLAIFIAAGFIVPAILAYTDEGNYNLGLEQIFSIDFLGLFLVIGTPCIGAMIMIHELISHRMNKSWALVVSVFGGILSGCLVLAVLFTSMFYLIRLIH
jgi:hypothetical protein